MSRAERGWVLVALAIIVAGVVVGILYQLGAIPLWASTLSTLLMATGAVAAALLAARSNRNEKNG